MADNRRKSDKIQKYTDRLSKIAYGVGIAFIIYIVFPLKNDIRDMRQEFKTEIHELKIKQEENLERLYEFSGQCKEDINQVRKEYKEDISKILDKMYAWFKAEK